MLNTDHYVLHQRHPHSLIINQPRTKCCWGMPERWTRISQKQTSRPIFCVYSMCVRRMFVFMYEPWAVSVWGSRSSDGGEYVLLGSGDSAGRSGGRKGGMDGGGVCRWGRRRGGCKVVKADLIWSEFIQAEEQRRKATMIDEQRNQPGCSEMDENHSVYATDIKGEFHPQIPAHCNFPDWVSFFFIRKNKSCLVWLRFKFQRKTVIDLCMCFTLHSVNVTSDLNHVRNCKLYHITHKGVAAWPVIERKNNIFASIKQAEK